MLGKMCCKFLALAFLYIILVNAYADGFSMFNRHKKQVPNDPFTSGEYPINHTTILNAVNIFSDTNLDVYAPNVPGNFPVFYFITGLTAVIPAELYTMFLSQIASHGFVAIGIWKVDGPLHSFNATWFDETVDYVENRLERNLHLNGFDSKMHVDYLNSFIGGHSSGAHIPVAQFLAHCLNFKGLILLNPVDGGDPLGLLPYFVITPGEKVNFTVPMMQIVAGFDDDISNTTHGACAPDFLSGRRFFDAMTGPSWYINATNHGHADFMDPAVEQVVEILEFCPTDPNSPKDAYRRFVTGQIVSFMYAVLDPINNCFLLDNLETSGLVGIETENDYASNGWIRCTPTQCTNNVQD